jgi:flavodoxin
MRALVVYESQFGNTEQIACAIAIALESCGAVSLRSVDDVGTFEEARYDLLFFGCPTQLHGASPGMRALLAVLRDDALTGQRFAVFDTSYPQQADAGSATENLIEEIKRKGGQIVAPPEHFRVVSQVGPLQPDELGRAGRWATGIAARVQSLPV